MKPEDYHIAIVKPYSYQPFRSINQLAELLESSFKALGCKTSLHTPPSSLGDMTQGSGVVHKVISSFERMSIAPGLFSARMGKLRAQLEKENKKLLIFITDQNFSSLNFALSGFDVVQVINDMISVRHARGDFGHTSSWGTRFNQRSVLGGLTNVSRFMAFSQASKDDLLRILPGVREQSILVCGLPLAYNYGPMKEADLSDAQHTLWRRFNLMPQDYLLHVGSDAWYKNRLGLVRLYGELNKTNNVMPVLAFAGGAPTPQERALAKEYGVDIYHFANLSDSELNALYCGARACVMPSFIEGFCWPALEALSSGCPLAISATPCLDEHFGDAAAVILPDPSNVDPDEWVQQSIPYFQELLDADEQTLGAIAQAGLEAAQRFTTKRFQNALAQYLDLS